MPTIVNYSIQVDTLIAIVKNLPDLKNEIAELKKIRQNTDIMNLIMKHSDQARRIETSEKLLFADNISGLETIKNQVYQKINRLFPGCLLAEDTMQLINSNTDNSRNGLEEIATRFLQKIEKQKQEWLDETAIITQHLKVYKTVADVIPALGIQQIPLKALLQEFWQLNKLINQTKQLGLLTEDDMIKWKDLMFRATSVINETRNQIQSCTTIEKARDFLDNTLELCQQNPHQPQDMGKLMPLIDQFKEDIANHSHLNKKT